MADIIQDTWSVGGGESVRIIHVDDILVDQARLWQGVVRTCFPTLPEDHPFYRIGRRELHNPPVWRTAVDLVNFPHEGVWQGGNLEDWAESNSLRAASPDVVFSLVREKPHLCQEVDETPLSLISLTPYSLSGSLKYCGVKMSVSLRREPLFLPAKVHPGLPKHWVVFTPIIEEIDTGQGCNGKAAA